MKGKRPLGGLEYKKDPSRPGGGVFVARGDGCQGDYEGITQGIIVTSSDEESDGKAFCHIHDSASSLYRPDLLGCQGSSLVNITPLTASQAGGDGSSAPAGFLNMNPALNNVTTQTPGNVQVLNVLDVPEASTTLEQFAMADVGFLEGIPGGMFDWGMYNFTHR